MPVPLIRIDRCNGAATRPDGEYVLYWMIAFRRPGCNFALQRAVEWASELRRPLVVFEALRVGYRWASDRLHRFVLDGMGDNACRFDRPGVAYYPYVEPRPDADKGLLAALAERACVVVTDDFPSFFLPRMVRAAATRLDVLVEQVDANGLLPLRATERVFTTARSFRAFLQKHLALHLEELPEPDPLARLARRKLPSPERHLAAIRRRWPPVSSALLDISNAVNKKGHGQAAARELARFPIDHAVRPAPMRGGYSAARRAMREFLARKLSLYVEQGNDPDEGVRSGLSPYLHFGHISPHEVFWEIAQRENWSPQKLARNGGRRGWWGVGEPAEVFLDQLVTWRELGYNLSAHQHGYDRYDSLPAWAKVTLAKHARDRRPQVYTLAEFESAATHDRLWNAAQNQLLREGRMHNYLRMLWGKKILEWSPTPEQALETMIELNNKYAIDGRNPNSYSGIFWVLGRYDRPWGPERPIFGHVRYMSSVNTLRKLRVREFLERYGAGAKEN